MSNCFVKHTRPVLEHYEMIPLPSNPRQGRNHRQFLNRIQNLVTLFNALLPSLAPRLAINFIVRKPNVWVFALEISDLFYDGDCIRFLITFRYFVEPLKSLEMDIDFSSAI